MTLELILQAAHQAVGLPEQQPISRLLLLLSDDVARLMRRVESSGASADRREPAHLLPIEECHRILTRSLALVREFRAPGSSVREVFEEWQGARVASESIPARAHIFRQAVAAAVIAKFDLESDAQLPGHEAQKAAIGVFRAAMRLVTAAQTMRADDFISRLPTPQAA